MLVELTRIDFKVNYACDLRTKELGRILICLNDIELIEEARDYTYIKLRSGKSYVVKEPFDEVKGLMARIYQVGN